MKRLLSLAILLLFPLCCPAQGADNERFGLRRVERLSDEENLISESQVWCIACGDNPIAFFATYNGLFSYDGVRIRRHYDRRVLTLRALVLDKAGGRLYSAGNNGFGWWEKDNLGGFEYHPIETDDRSIINQDFWRCCINANGEVFFQSSNRICVFSPANNSLRTIHPSGQFRYMFEVDGQVLVQDGDGLYNVNGDLTLDWICNANDRIMNIVSCAGKRIAALERTGLMELVDGGLSPMDAGSNRILSESKILSLATFDLSHLIVGTTQGGFFITTSEGKICNRTMRFQQTGKSTVLAVSKDRNGDIWLGMEAGAARADNSSGNYYLQDSQLGRVRGVITLGSQTLLAGSNKGAFVYENGSFRPVPGTTGSVWNISKIDGVPYIAHDQGLFTLDNRMEAKPLFTGSGVMSIVQCNTDKSAYICGTYNGLVLLRKSAGGLSFVSDVANYSGFCRSMHMDTNDRLWIRDSHKGFIRLSLDKDFTRVVSRKDFDLVKEDGDHIFTIETKDGLLFCCNRDAYRIDYETGDLVRSCQDDRIAEEFETTEPFPLENGAYASGLLDGIMIHYGPRVIDENIYISEVNLMGANSSRLASIDGSRVKVPFTMNSVRVYLAGNFNSDLIEYSIDDKVWNRARAKEAVQLSSLPFGKHTVFFRLPGATKEMCSLNLLILRPWYLKGWAIFAYLAIIAGILLVVREYYRRKTERLRLKADLKTRSAELANITFNKAQRNNQLNEIRKMLTSASSISRPQELAKASLKTVQLIDSYLQDEEDWKKSEEYFNVIYDGLLEKLKKAYPGISKTDMKLCVYTKLNLSTKEIADLMNISVRSVEMARYRLRKRLGLPCGEDIRDFVKDL